tara:strand:- start:167 stop:349 length:183 start_codon:yes stop_codon:yes gene_type:complete
LILRKPFYTTGKTLATIIISGASDEEFQGPWVKYGTLRNAAKADKRLYFSYKPWNTLAQF